MGNLSMKWNPSQIKAASHASGPCLVLAGPGSGKTAVITKRTEQLIARCGGSLHDFHPYPAAGV